MSATVRPVQVVDHDGIKILPSIDGAPGLDTLEGRIGPLLNAERGGCHFIEVPGGAYADEHAHPTESLIYTLRGQWVLCSRGTRWHMQAGSLFWFGDNVPTGYENPFDEPAYLLIFKTGERQPGYDASMLDRISEVASHLDAERAAGTPFSFTELPQDHPAKVFARNLPRAGV
jgi:quercetin dioxygenase-like cupin family protein